MFSFDCLGASWQTQSRPWLENHWSTNQKNPPSTLLISEQSQGAACPQVCSLVPGSTNKENNVLSSFLNISPKLSLPRTVLITREQSRRLLDPIYSDFWRGWASSPFHSSIISFLPSPSVSSFLMSVLQLQSPPNYLGSPFLCSLSWNCTYQQSFKVNA